MKSMMPYGITGLERVKAPDFLDVSALHGWYVVSQTHRPPLPHEKSLVFTFRG